MQTNQTNKAPAIAGATPKVISKSLQRDIDYIKTRNESAKKCVFEIAWKLREIADSNDLLDAGYNNIVEFAAEQFGYKRSTVLNYVAAARKYMERHIDTKEKPYLSTTCARIDTDKHEVTEDYNIGQLIALGRTSGDDFMTMDSEGVIKPEMTAKEIKDAVKKWYQPLEDPKPELKPEPTQDPEPEEQEEPAEYTRTLTLSEMVICLCGGLIGEEYDIDVDTAVDDAFQNLTRGNYRLDFCYRNEDGDKIIEFVYVWANDGSCDPVLKYPSENI